jgi:2-haloacid dehalogenase
MKPRAFIFDAYGTLFDVYSSVVCGNAIPVDPQPLATLWRRKQLEYTWLRSLMERYEDFWEVTSAALRSAINELGIAADEAQVNRLMQTYLHADVFPDTKPALTSLAGSHLAILSNGSPAMLEAVIHNNGLDRCFAEVISVDRVKTYKPSPRVYALGPEILGIPAEEILFVSANSWDAAGAKAFGYKVCWCNRAKSEPERLGCPADIIVARLDEIHAHVMVNR